MNKGNFLAPLLLTAALIGGVGCAKNPADNVPKAGVNPPAASGSPVAQASPSSAVASATPSVVASATPAVSGTPGTTAPGLAFAEGSEVKFKGSKVTGSHEGGFRKVTGAVDVPADGDLTKATIDVTIDMSSTYSDDEKLTGHLVSPDFFDVAKYPTATFKSTAITKTDDGYLVTGDLDLHGVKKSINFPAQIAENGGALTAKAEFAINRKDFAIVYPGKPDDLIRDEVVISFDLKAGNAPG